MEVGQIEEGELGGRGDGRDLGEGKTRDATALLSSSNSLLTHRERTDPHQGRPLPVGVAPMESIMCIHVEPIVRCGALSANLDLCAQSPPLIQSFVVPRPQLTCANKFGRALDRAGHTRLCLAIGGKERL